MQPEGVTVDDWMESVSILIRPEGRMQLAERVLDTARSKVSILIRPEGRMQPVKAWAAMMVAELFQSSSGQKAGCNIPKGAIVATAVLRFQSSSGQKAGCNLHHDGSERAFQPVVSILIRPEGRMQPP